MAVEEYKAELIKRLQKEADDLKMFDYKADEIAEGVTELVKTMEVEINNRLDGLIRQRVNQITNQYHVEVNAEKIAEACMKQLPHKPRKIRLPFRPYHQYDACGNCGARIIGSMKYCSECGTKIDRGEE